ncbi:DUF7133 domain-containing protein [Negadavirga shengliensis]
MMKSKSQTDKNPSPPKSPGEEWATFQIEEGLDIQLVASEPLVQDPVVISFDEDGRLWVVEMRGFMPDIDGKGENEPVGRINVLEDTDGDGIMDMSTIYLDSLIMPRALAVVKDGALVVENMALWWTRDLDGDLTADTKVLIDPDYAGSNLPEHSGNGLWRGMDNWYYNAKSNFRYRMADDQWIRDSTEYRGQWGISHDDYGRLIYNYNWSQLHGDLVPPNYLSRNKHHTPTTGIDHGLTVDRRIYPIRTNPAVNRGYIPGILDEQGRLMEFTSACAPFYYRSQTLPSRYYGNVFVCEPSGNLIKRNVVSAEGLYLTAEDPHPGVEFLASTDERFRPVFLASGPDGALYMADMYRGLVQHGAYISPYLREQTLSRNLVLPVNMGRIWRIVPKGWTPAKVKKLSAFSPEALARELFNENGWQRDMAQRLLVERGDPESQSFLRNAVSRGKDPYGRIHALWTLEGLGMLDTDLLFTTLSDPDPGVRATSLRLLEPFAAKETAVKNKLGQMLSEAWEDAPIEFVLQTALSAGVLETDYAHELLTGITTRYASIPLIRDAVLSSLENKEYAFLQNLLKLEDWKRFSPEKEIFLEMISTAVAKKGEPTELKRLLAALDVNKASFGWQQQAILTGMSMHGITKDHIPVTLDSAPGLLSQDDLNIDPRKLQALAVLFEWPGHEGQQWTSTKKHELIEEQFKQFGLGRQYYLSTCSGCHGTDGSGSNRMGPPLANSEWVIGDEKQLSLIILHGMEGPVEVGGKLYDEPEILPVMPAHSNLDDATIAAIMTYIRNEWGNDAGAVSRRNIALNRNTLQGRVYPWKAEELKKYILEDKRNLSSN